MKILWVVNTLFPDAARRLGLAPTVYGGWMYGLAADLAGSPEVELAVATIQAARHELQSFIDKDVRYYILPANRHGRMREDWCRVVDEFKPDLVHIHGTEYGHGMALMDIRPDLNYVVSIQGLVSVCHRYYLAGMSHWDVLRNLTFRDIVRGDSLFQARRKFYDRGEIEKEYLRRANAVIGRTDWDRAHAWAINPQVPYYFCNESLRDEFYTGEQWSLKSCRRHSIFLSQASYPIKGLHQVLKAIALLKQTYPDLLVEVAGPDITKTDALKDRLRLSGYGRYLRSLIAQLGLNDSIRFIGTCSSEDMKRAYLRAHLFVCPSTIENSPNSLGEAQILGVPCIATYSGGIPSMTTQGNSVLLYRYDEHEMLAFMIGNCFSEDAMMNRLSRAAAMEAATRHDRIESLKQLKWIYQSLLAAA